MSTNNAKKVTDWDEEVTDVAPKKVDSWDEDVVDSPKQSAPSQGAESGLSNFIQAPKSQSGFSDYTGKPISTYTSPSASTSSVGAGSNTSKQKSFTSLQKQTLEKISFDSKQGQANADLKDFINPNSVIKENPELNFSLDDLTLRTKVVRGLLDKTTQYEQELGKGVELLKQQGVNLIEEYKANPTPILKAQIEQKQRDYEQTLKEYNKQAFIKEGYEKRILQTSDSIKKIANSNVPDNFYAGLYSGMKGNVNSYKEAYDLFKKSKAEQIQYAKDKALQAPTKEEGTTAQAGEMIGGVIPDIAQTIGFSLLGLPNVGVYSVAARQGAQQASDDFVRAFNKAKTEGVKTGKFDANGNPIMREPTDDEAYDIATNAAGVGGVTGFVEGMVGAKAQNLATSLINRKVAGKGAQVIANKIADTGIDAATAVGLQTARNAYDNAQGLNTELSEGLLENASGEILLSAPTNAYHGTKEYKQAKQNERAREIFESVVASKDDPDALNKLQQNLDIALKNKLITEQDYVDITRKTQEYQRVIPTIPDEIKNKQGAADLIIERDELEAKKENTDKAFQKPIDEALNVINEKITNVDVEKEEFSKPIKYTSPTNDLYGYVEENGVKRDLTKQEFEDYGKNNMEQQVAATTTEEPQRVGEVTQEVFTTDEKGKSEPIELSIEPSRVETTTETTTNETPKSKEAIVPSEEGAMEENINEREQQKAEDVGSVAKSLDAEQVRNKLQEIEKQPVKINVTQDANGKMEQTSQEVIDNIKAELDKTRLPYSDVVANDRGSTYFVITKDNQQHEILKVLQSGGKLVPTNLTKAKWINHLIKTEKDAVVEAIEGLNKPKEQAPTSEQTKSQTNNKENEADNIQSNREVYVPPTTEEGIKSERSRIESEEAESGVRTGVEKINDIAVRPDIFQFKAQDEASGVNLAEKLQGDFDVNLAGAIGVWKDEKGELGEKGKVYVVDGHHRMEFAKRSGVKNMNVFYIDAPTAKDARVTGAKANIAQGRGTSIDAAKVYKEATPKQLEGFKPTSRVAKEGMELAKLENSVFNLVVQGKLDIPTAMAIAKVEKPKQESFYKAIKRIEDSGAIKMTSKGLSVMAEKISSGGVAVNKVQEMDLFGTTEQEELLLAEQSQLESDIKDELAKDAKILGSANKNKAVLEKAENVVNEEVNAKLAEQSRLASGLFDTYKNRKEVSDIIKQATIDLNNAKGRKQRAEIKDKATSDVKKAIEAELNKDFNKENTKENAVQEQSAGKVLQREQGKVGEAGSEREGVESSQQGQETTEQSEEEVKNTQNDFQYVIDKANKAGKGVKGSETKKINLSDKETAILNKTIEKLEAKAVANNGASFNPNETINIQYEKINGKEQKINTYTVDGYSIKYKYNGGKSMTEITTPQGDLLIVSKQYGKTEIAYLGKSESLLSKEQTPAKEEAPALKDVKPIRQLGTGANVYFETNKHRVNDDLKSGKVLLNVGSKEDEVPMANIKFDNAAEAVAVAKELDRIYPKGVPNAVLIDKVVEDIRKKQAQEVKTKPLSEEIADLRAKEQAEYDAMSNPNDKAKRDEIYDRYDELITPLLREQKALESTDALKDVESTAKALEGIDKTDLEFISRKENNRRKSSFYEKAKGILFKGFGGNASIISDKFGSKYKYFTDNPDYAKSFSLEKEYLTQKGKVEKYETNYKREFNTNEKDYNNEVLKHSGKKSINDLTSKDFDNFNNKLKADGYDVVNIKRNEPLIPSEAYRGYSADIRNVEVEEHLILNDKAIKKIADQPSLLENNAKSISEAYHKAKADGSNPELVKAVESLLSKETPTETTKPTEKAQEGKAEQDYQEAISKKSERAKNNAKEKFINDNFDKIVSQLMLENKIKRKC